MDNQVLVNRIYSVQVTGVDAGVKTIQDLNNAILATDTAFQAIKAQLQAKIDAGGTATEVAKLTTEAKKLSDQLADLIAKQQASGKETLLLAKANTELAKTEAINAKEADRKLDRADKLAKAAAKQAAANDVEAESYAHVRQQMAELRPFIQGNNSGSTKTISFAGQDLNFEGAILKFKELSATEANFRRQFATDNILVGEYSRGILHAFNEAGVGGDFFKNQKDQINNQLKQLVQESKNLAQQMQTAGTVGGEAFGNIDKQLRDNIANQEKLRGSLKNIEAEYGGIGKSVTTGISDSFKNIKGQLSQMIVGYLGFQAAISGVQSIIHQNAELSDSLAQLRIRLHGNKEAADEVFESLKKLNTRTSLGELVDTASIVAKKGVAKEEITGITDALDKFFVVAGKEGGNREEGTASVVKLISIFNDDKHVTKERVTELASAMIGLQNSGVASSQYLIDFAERVGSVRGLTGITLPNVLGLGAAMQQLGQKSEVAASSSIQILTKILADVPKYAKAAGVGVDVFRDKLKNNPFEALVTLGQNLKNNASGFEEVSQDLQEIGVNGARVKAFFADVATNADFVRLKMKAAGTQIGDSTALLSANQDMQNTFAATLEKISKQFELIGANKTFQAILLAIASAISLILTNITPLIGAIGVYTAIWAIANAAMIRVKIATLATNIALEAQYAWIVVSGTVTKAYTVALEAYTAVTEGAAAATTLFELAVESIFPVLGVILVIIGVLAASFKVFGASVMDTTEALRKNVLQNKIDSEIREKANKSIADQIAKLNTLVSVVTSSATSYGTSKKALDELIQTNNKFSSAIKDNIINLNEVKRVLKEVTEEMFLNAKAQAAAELSKDKFKDILQVGSTQGKIEETLGVGKKNEFGHINIDSGLGKEDEDLIRSAIPTDAFGGDTDDKLTKNPDIEYHGRGYNSKELFKKLNAIKQAREIVYQEYQKTFNNLQNQVEQQTQKNAADKVASQSSVFDRFKTLIKIGGKDSEWDSLKKDIADERSKFKTTSTDYQELKKLEEQIDNYLNPKKNKNKNPDKGPFSKIDAERDTNLAQEEEAMLKKKQAKEFSYVAELTYIDKIKNINKKALDEKINYLSKKKVLSDEEKLQEAQFKKELVDLEIKANTQINDVHKRSLDDQKKEFEKKSTSLSDNLDNTKKTSTAKYEDVANNPDSTEGQKLIAKQNQLNTELAAQTNFNIKMNDLENDYGQESEKNAQKRADEIIKINTELKKNNYDIQREVYYQQEETSVKNEFNKKRKDILDNDKLSSDNKDKALEALDKAEKIRLATIELNKANSKYAEAIKELKEAQDELDNVDQTYDPSIGLEASKKRADEKVNSANNKVASTGEAANTAQTNLNGLTENPKQQYSSIGKFLGFDNANTDLGKQQYAALASTISASYQFAGQAMNTYFDTERIRIENSLKLAERQIDATKRVALGHAQSAAETDTIERRAEAQKLAAQKSAFEQNKKMQKAQAEISLATQLANIGAVAFTPNEENLVSGGIWGTIFYAVQAALAVGEYAMNVQKINSAQFATGGKIVGLSSGKITTTSNIPARSNGDNVLATVKTGEVILNESQQKALGGDATFASIGVPGFAGGGYTGWKPLGNQDLGSILKAPINPASFLLGNNNNNNSNQYVSKDIEEMKAMIKENARQVSETAEHVKNIQVHVVSKQMTNQQRKDSIQASIGRLG